MLKITCRDFINSTLAGAGAGLLYAKAPLASASLSNRPFPPTVVPSDGWYGFGGIGDYASSHGNTPEVFANAHAIRHGKFNEIAADWIDTMSIKDYLEKVLGLDPAVTAYVDPIIAAGVGSPCDTTSTYVLFITGLPGFGGYHDVHLDNRHSFPGGNTGFARYFVKRIMP